MTKTSELPTIKVTEQGWVMAVPADLLPDGVGMALTAGGIYIDLGDGRRDLLPYGELAGLLDDLAEPLEEGEDDMIVVPLASADRYVMTPAGFAAMEAGAVKVAKGAAPVALTGRERALLEWIGTFAGGGVVLPVGGSIAYAEAPERLVTANGRV